MPTNPVRRSPICFGCEGPITDEGTSLFCVWCNTNGAVEADWQQRYKHDFKLQEKLFILAGLITDIGGDQELGRKSREAAILALHHFDEVVSGPRH